MAERSYRWLLITLAVVGLGVDQVTKYGVFRWLYNDGHFAKANGNEYEVKEGWFRLIAQFNPDAPAGDCVCENWSAPVKPHVNRGALFGLGGSEGSTANWFFAGVSVLAAIAILVWGTRKGPAKERWLSAALGLILGGTVGNLYDRVVFGGVRDFLYFYKIEWPVFNVADCCLVVGAALLLVQAVFATPAAKPDPTPTDEPAIPAAPKA
jgi:lipoprotein signal peptidase